MQIRDASESLLKGLLGGKSLAEMTSSCSLETQTQYFCTESGQKWLNLTLLLQSLYCTLKDKGKHHCLKTNGPPAPSNHLKVVKQSEVINIITKLYSSPWESRNYSSVSFAGIYVWLYFLSFFSHMSLLRELSASLNSLWDSISPFLVLPETCTLCVEIPEIAKLKPPD